MARKASPLPRAHRGDIMSVEKRSAVMARIKGRNTGPERLIADAMRSRGWSWEEHCGDLPGRPDFIFRALRIAIFVDGDFWHGWRFPRWRHKLSEKWDAKIHMNRERDWRNHCRLRRSGWKVLRIWEHQIDRSLSECVSRIERARALQGIRFRAPPPEVAQSPRL
jgi:DNA mismatch endonuclease (patch repair protein)